VRHRGYVGPAEVFDSTGRYCFDLLKNLKLESHHKLLDVGCGGLRTGKFLIQYLNAGNYTGVEPEAHVVESAKKYEIGCEILEAKKPNFSHESNFDFKCLPIQDFIFCYDVFYHCGKEQLAVFLENIKHISNFKTKTIVSVMFADGNPHETTDGIYKYKYASHSNVYYEIQEFTDLANKFGYECKLLNENEKRFFSLRLIFLLEKSIKF
jgi:cyclopropane fatty-acyl-phospholipid synthase-like methyltransferase